MVLVVVIQYSLLYLSLLSHAGGMQGEWGDKAPCARHISVSVGSCPIFFPPIPSYSLAPPLALFLSLPLVHTVRPRLVYLSSSQYFGLLSTRVCQHCYYLSSNGVYSGGSPQWHAYRGCEVLRQDVFVQDLIVVSSVVLRVRALPVFRCLCCITLCEACMEV